MAEQKIQLSDIQGGSTLNSKFYESDTILDLRKRFAKAQGMEFEYVTLYQTFLKLNDEKLVRDLINNEEEISFGIDCGCMHDYIWVVRNGKWNKLFEGQEYFLEERNILKSGSSFGEFAIVRNRYVIVVLQETLLFSLLLWQLDGIKRIELLSTEKFEMGIPKKTPQTPTSPNGPQQTPTSLKDF